MANLSLNPNPCRYHYRRLLRICIRLASASLLFIFATVELRGQTPKPAGYVLSISGAWKSTTSNRALKQFQSLQSQARVFPVKPIKQGHFITIALFNGDTIRVRCKEGSCGQSIVIPTISRPVTDGTDTIHAPGGGPPKRSPARGAEKTQQPSLTDRVAAAFWSLFHGHEPYIVPVFVRDDATADLREAVLENSSGKVALAPAFQDLPKGRYRIVATKLNAVQPQVSTATLSLNIDWDPQQPAKAQAALDPGLYQLVGLEKLESWVLVTTGNQYPQASNALAGALKLSNEWSNEIDPADSRMFLRAFLATLARGIEESPK